MFIGKKMCDMSEVLQSCIDQKWNLHVVPFKYSLPDLRKSVPPLKSCLIDSNAWM